jgi:hypothetical protein
MILCSTDDKEWLGWKRALFCGTYQSILDETCGEGRERLFNNPLTY